MEVKTLALGRRKTEGQGELFIMASELAEGSGHRSYQKLNVTLREIEFGRVLEEFCVRYFLEGGRSGIAPGGFFGDVAYRLFRRTGQASEAQSGAGKIVGTSKVSRRHDPERLL